MSHINDSVEKLKQIADRHSLSDLEEGGKVWELIRKAGSESFYFFHKFIWSALPPQKNLMTYRTHGPMCLAAQDESLKRVLFEYPRRHLKSSIITVGYAPFDLHRMIMRGEDPCKRFFFMAHNMKAAGRQWTDTRLGFARKKFRFFCPELIPPTNLYKRNDEEKPFKWNEEEGEIFRNYRTTEPTFQPIAAQIVGPHYDHGFLDDLINSENYDSPTAVEKAIDMYKHSFSLLEDAECRLFVIGNSWGMNDLNAEVIAHAESTGFTVISVDTEEGANLNGPHACRGIPDSVRELLDAIPTPIWPERFDEQALSHLRHLLGPRIYSSQMKNNPSDPDVTDFNVGHVKSCKLVTGEYGVEIDYGEEGRIPIADCHLYVTWDPALEKTKTTNLGKKSENGIVVTFIDPYGRCGVIREYSKIEDPLKSMDKFLDYCNTFEGYVKGAGVEEVLFQKTLKKLLRKRLKERKIYAPVRAVKTPRNMGSKDARIRAWLGVQIESGKFYVDPSCRKTLDQIRLFGVEGAKRDLLDAIAYATRMWQKPRTSDERRALKRSRKIQEANRGITGYGRVAL